MPIQTKIALRRGTFAEWTNTNPVLSLGEPGYETDSGRFKIGNGASGWTTLPYFVGEPGAPGEKGESGGEVAGFDLVSGSLSTAGHYIDALEWVENWANKTHWNGAGATADPEGTLNSSISRLYAPATGSGSAYNPWEIVPGQLGRVTGLFRWVPGQTGNFYFGLNFTGDTTATANNVYIGINSSGARQYYLGSTAAAGGAEIQAFTVVGTTPTVATTYAVSIDITEDQINFSAVSTTFPKDDFWNFVVPRKDLTVHFLTLYYGDTRGTSGSSWGAMASVDDSIQPVRTKLVNASTIDGYVHRHINVRSPSSRNDVWHLQIPKNYNPIIGAPLIIDCHKSGGDELTPYTEAAVKDFAAALGDAGYIIATARDDMGVPARNHDGRRWGNPASVANYLRLHDWTRKHFNVKDVFVIGSSMGGVAASNLLTKGGLKANGAVFVGAVFDMKTLYSNSTFTAPMNTSYAASTEAEFDTNSAGWNPISKPEQFENIPMRIYYGTGDTTVLGTTNSVEFHNRVSGFTTSTLIAASGGHLAADQYRATEVINFFDGLRT